MTVKELIETLKQYDENAEVLLEAQDSGGSYYEALEVCVRQASYDKDKHTAVVEYDGEKTHYYIQGSETEIKSDKIILL